MNQWIKTYGITSTSSTFTVKSGTVSEVATGQIGWKKWQFVFHSWEGNMTKDVTFELNNGLSTPFMGSKEPNLSNRGDQAAPTGYLKKDDWGFYDSSSSATAPLVPPAKPPIKSG